ncbi:MAG: hypothetical protein J5611_00585 [Alphaproteobacteria bacterium]|nr:hypothetical protein [Alphaproteobacteria bacterium]
MAHGYGTETVFYEDYSFPAIQGESECKEVVDFASQLMDQPIDFKWVQEDEEAKCHACFDK